VPDEDQSSRPVCKRVSSRGRVGMVPALILPFSFSESRNIIVTSTALVVGQPPGSSTAMKASPTRTMIGSNKSTQPPSPAVAVAKRF